MQRRIFFFVMLYHDIDFCLSCVSISFRLVMKTFLGLFLVAGIPCIVYLFENKWYNLFYIKVNKLITHDLTLYCANDHRGVCKD